MVLGVALVLGFFYIYLPITTHHGDTITVPSVEQLAFDKAVELLEDSDLRYVVTDSTYNPNLPPLTVVKQDPAVGAKVKVNRRIHLTVNSQMPPMEQVPNIIDNSLRQADLVLESYGFKRGKVEFVPDPAANAVLKMFHKGREFTRAQLNKGVSLPKGSVIDLQVGDGVGDTEFEMPNLVGKFLSEAEYLTRGVGLGINVTAYQQAPGKKPGTILSQAPAYAPGAKIKLGDIIDVVVVGEEVVEEEIIEQ
jgi:beta-lactam-binding protein with PASTA domain